MSVEIANMMTASARRIGHQLVIVPKAAEMSRTPSGELPVSTYSAIASWNTRPPPMTTVSADMRQTTTVSRNGSSSATKPSDTGRRVLTAE